MCKQYLTVLTSTGPRRLFIPRLLVPMALRPRPAPQRHHHLTKLPPPAPSHRPRHLQRRRGLLGLAPITNQSHPQPSRRTLRPYRARPHAHPACRRIRRRPPKHQHGPCSRPRRPRRHCPLPLCRLGVGGLLAPTPGLAPPVWPAHPGLCCG